MPGTFFVLFVFFSLTCVRGLKVPFEQRAVRGASASSLRAATYTFGTTEREVLANVRDLRYATNITINGKTVPVALDTGSTDMWVNPPGGIGSFNDTGIPLQLLYGDGTYGAAGTIGVSPFTFGSYRVQRQAFLHATNVTIGLLNNVGLYGLFGLSFDFVTSSPINAEIKARYGNTATWGQSVLQNIFDQQPNQPKFIALYLSRTDDLEDTQGGSFFIGEYDPKFADVARSPELPQHPVGGDRWTTLLEGIYVGGEAISITSSIGGVPAGRALALLDTGVPTALFPAAIWNAIYSLVPGAAKYHGNNYTLWVVPCNTTTIVELVFGGQKFAIHPLDLSVISVPPQVNGQTYTACISSFYTMDGFASNEYEILLGDSFLRNVYSVYTFGNSTSTSKPHMQLLSRTNSTRAVAQVSTIRGTKLASLPPELPPTTLVRLLNSSSEPDGDPVGPTNTASSAMSVKGNGLDISITEQTVRTYGLLIVCLLVANVIISLALFTFAVLRYMRKGGSRAKPSSIKKLRPCEVESGTVTTTQHHTRSLHTDFILRQA